MSSPSDDDERARPEAGKKRKKTAPFAREPPALAGPASSLEERIRAATGRRSARKTSADGTPDFGFLSRDHEDAARSAEAAREGATEVEGIDQSAWGAVALHLNVAPMLGLRAAGHPLEPPDLEAARARFESDLGVPELESELAEFGTPPVLPPAPQVDPQELERELLEAGGEDVARWKLGTRRSLRRDAREQAVRQARDENRRLAAEQEQLQQELDECWAQLRELRYRAAREAEKWVAEEALRLDAARERETLVDEEPHGERNGHPSEVTARLRAGFRDGAARDPDGPAAVIDGATTVLGFLDGVAVVVVICPDRDEALTGTDLPSAGGRPRDGSEAAWNQLYLSAIASRVLAAVGGVLSATPAVGAVTCVAVRSCASGARAWEPIYVGTFERAYTEQLVADGCWSTDTDSLVRTIKEADEVDLELRGHTHALAALDLSDDPGLAAVMDRMEQATRSDEGTDLEQDQAAVAVFLLGSRSEDAADQPLDEPDTPVPAGAGAADESPGVPADESAREEQSAFAEPQAVIDAVPNDGRVAPEPGGDPLVAALNDPDGSVRRAAVEAIGSRNDPEHTRLLLDALSDVDEHVRVEAMFALKDRLSPDMRRDALMKSCGDGDAIVRRKAIAELAELRDERDTPVLLEALKDRDEGVRLEAIYAVKHRLTPDTRDALIKACDDADQRVRRTAVEALAQLDDQRDLPLLFRALRDSDSSVRLEAIYALEGRAALGSSSGLGELLLGAMRDEDAIVRQAAVRLFGRLEPPSAAQPPP